MVAGDPAPAVKRNGERGKTPGSRTGGGGKVTSAAETTPGGRSLVGTTVTGGGEAGTNRLTAGGLRRTRTGVEKTTAPGPNMIVPQEEECRSTISLPGEKVEKVTYPQELQESITTLLLRPEATTVEAPPKEKGNMTLLPPEEEENRTDLQGEEQNRKDLCEEEVSTAVPSEAKEITTLP